MIAWLVTLTDGRHFTYITDQCKTVDEVRAAILEKFCRQILSAEKL
jgi:hypothetical protein